MHTLGQRSLSHRPITKSRTDRDRAGTGIRPPALVVQTCCRAAARGRLNLGTLAWPCAIGRSGVRAIKREGDGATPRGRWPIRRVWYRRDRVGRPSTALPVVPIHPRDGWCDAPADRNYNRRVQLPYPASAEEMMRTDGLYDLVVELGFNDRPRRRGAGSAIFMHVARDDFAPTAGCVALSLRHLLCVLRWLRPGSTVWVLR
jgi:L,D-peptidoglycan transpeptidase YkuD (ErfK/YbiS/YcfS/YnhG family)